MSTRPGTRAGSEPVAPSRRHRGSTSRAGCRRQRSRLEPLRGHAWLLHVLLTTLQSPPHLGQPHERIGVADGVIAPRELAVVEQMVTPAAPERLGDPRRVQTPDAAPAGGACRASTPRVRARVQVRTEVQSTGGPSGRRWGVAADGMAIVGGYPVSTRVRGTSTTRAGSRRGRPILRATHVCQGRNKIRPDGGGKPDHLAAGSCV